MPDWMLSHPESNFSHVTPSAGQVQGGYLRGIESVLEARGSRARDILERYEIETAPAIGSEQPIDCRVVIDLLEYCSRRQDDPLFGVHLAEAQQPDVLGCVIPLARSAPDFGTALQQLVTYLPFVHCEYCQLEIVTSQSSVEVRWASSRAFEACEQDPYHFFILIYNTLRMLGGRDLLPKYAALGCNLRSRDLNIVTEKIGCPIYPRSEANLIAFDPGALRHPILTANQLVFTVLGRALQSVLKLSSEAATDKVKAFVADALADGGCDVDTCAVQLGMSSRTLQKRLADEGTTFSNLVELTRTKVATHGLANTATSIDEIAYGLGYSEQSAFTRAFKRWTGETPNSYRRQHLRKARETAAGTRVRGIQGSAILE